MKCPGCGGEIPQSSGECPGCGRIMPEGGVFRTRTVWVASDGPRLEYSSLEDVPPRLREKIERSTHSGNAATVVIADVAGREELRRQLPEALAPPKAPEPRPPRGRSIAARVTLGAIVILSGLGGALWLIAHWK